MFILEKYRTMSITHYGPMTRIFVGKLFFLVKNRMFFFCVKLKKTFEVLIVNYKEKRLFVLFFILFYVFISFLPINQFFVIYKLFRKLKFEIRKNACFLGEYNQFASF